MKKERLLELAGVEPSRLPPLKEGLVAVPPGSACKKFIDILKSQIPDQKRNGWPKINFDVKHKEKYITVVFDELAFYFDKDGQFLGVVNFQE